MNKFEIVTLGWLIANTIMILKHSKYIDSMFEALSNLANIELEKAKLLNDAIKETLNSKKDGKIDEKQSSV